MDIVIGVLVGALWVGGFLVGTILMVSGTAAFCRYFRRQPLQATVRLVLATALLVTAVLFIANRYGIGTI